MLRILFVILAVVATILAVVFELPILYAAAAILLGFAAFEVAGRMKKHRDKEAEPFVRKAPSPDEELASLGIVGIRPKDKTVKAEEPAGSESGGAGRPVAKNGPRVRRSDWSEEDSADPRIRREVVVPLLESAVAALDATTVAILRQGDGALKYQIEGIASRNSFARSRGHFYTKVPLLTPDCIQQGVVFYQVGGKALSASNLGYYLETIAIRQVAIVPIVDASGDTASRFLLADTMEDGGLDSGVKQQLLAGYANLVGSVVAGAIAAPSATEPAESVTTLPVGTETHDEPVSEEPELEVRPVAKAAPARRNGQSRPRREIIAEEMDAAREDGSPLAFSLVHLRESETLAQQGELFIAEAEAALEAMLKEQTTDGRVERFGELTFGVFLRSDIAEAERWAIDVQQAAEEGAEVLQGGISLGIVIMGDRHDSAEALREDATEALRESFETGECMMVE